MSAKSYKQTQGVHARTQSSDGLTKAEISASSAATNAHTDYSKEIDPSTIAPTLPAHAARLSALLKSLSTAEGAVAESIKPRKALIGGHDKLVNSNTDALAKD
jgi:regulator of Ty1 transposition protein 103